MRCTLFDNHKCGGIYLTVKSENMKESCEIFLSQKLDNCLHGLMNIMNMDTCKHAGKKSFFAQSLIHAQQVSKRNYDGFEHQQGLSQFTRGKMFLFTNNTFAFCIRLLNNL